MISKDKIVQLKKLGTLRKRNCYPGFKNLGDFHSGLYESDFVSPYSKGSGNVDSEIFVLLQDWASADKIEIGMSSDAIRLGYIPTLQTNRNLQELLNITFELTIADVFTSNLFPFIKLGKMNAAIGSRWLRKSFNEFAMPQINIIQPKLVICCGKSVYRTAAQCLTGKRTPLVSFTDHFWDKEILFICQNHPGARGTNSVGGQDGAKRNWQIMKTMIETRLRY